MSILRLSRRDFLEHTAKGLAFGAGIGSFADFARAQAGDDDHYFVFVELKGGVQWMIATDGRDVSQLPMDDKNKVRTLQIKDEPLTQAEYNDYVGEYRDEMTEEELKALEQKERMNGEYIVVPYLTDLASAYKKGVTSLGDEYCLGWTAFPLIPHVDDIAVVRGVHMIGDFHAQAGSYANASSEFVSGSTTGNSPHVAAVLAKHFAAKYGPKLLDNLVFENATFSTAGSTGANPPVKLDGESLGYLVANSEASNESVEQAFARAKVLSQALAAQPSLGDLHKKVFNSYIDAMGQAPAVRSMLVKLKNELKAVDASLDLDIQFKTALTMLQSGLSRVITLCMGTPNGKNKVDGFGLFDCHAGLYHLETGGGDEFGEFDDDGNPIPPDPNAPPPVPATANTQRHHLNVEKTMKSLAKFIQTLKTTKFKNTNKSLFDVTTVVVGTEFARPSNFFGNESSAGRGNPGNGHYWFNNNYILFGKGVKGGTWVGKNDGIRQLGYKVQLASLEQTQTKNIVMEPFASVEGGGPNPVDGDYSGDKRPLMAKDVVKTVLAATGHEAKYGEAYSEDRVLGARTIRTLVK